jgi:hypothetical protein
MGDVHAAAPTGHVGDAMPQVGTQVGTTVEAAIPAPRPAPGADLVEAAAVTDTGRAAPAAWDLVDEWGMDSFPASDPPSNW